MTIYLFLILLVCVLDQLTKVYSMDLIAAACGKTAQTLAEGDTLPVLDGVLHLTYVENPGMSFGLLANARFVFIVLSVIGLLALTGYLVYVRGIRKKNDRLLCTALSLVIGGGIGNMFDRVRLGYVVDFFDVRFLPFWKWVFNLADACICVGAALLVLAVLLESKKEKKQ